MQMPVGFRPMLAAKCDVEVLPSLLQVAYIASPKIDGVRVVIGPNGPMTRSLKPVGNTYIRTLLTDERLIGLDGEIVVGEPNAPNVFNKTTGAVRRQSGNPDFTFLVFDDFTVHNLPYTSRLASAEAKVKTMQAAGFNFVKMLTHTAASVTGQDLSWWLDHWLADGYEGMCLRQRVGTYKFGRSTLNERGLLKFKPFDDMEGRVFGFEELMRNRNEATENALGLTERSHAQAGLVPGNTLGKLLVWTDEFGLVKLGSGFTEYERDHIWSEQATYLNKTVTFKYQKLGTIDKPRIAIFKGFRERE